MQNTTLSMLLFATLSGPALGARADAGPRDVWTPVATEDGIRLWKNEARGQTVPGFRGQVTVNSSLEAVVATIRDYRHHTKWMHNCQESREIKRLGKAHALLYNRTAAPWPVSDRDVVLRSERRDLGGGHIRVEFRSTTEEKLPATRGVVRMPRLAGSYDIRPVEGGTRVVYTVDSDPGGNLPDWLVRRASRNLPYNTLRDLRTRAESGPPPPR